MKRYIILGGGITGLSAAWYLLKKDPKAKITLLEKSDRLGGWIRTSYEEGFLFEKGPRTFRDDLCPHLLELIDELQLEIVEASPLASKRYILYRGKLREPKFFLFKFFPQILRECWIRPSFLEDESIYDFATRRFSSKVARTLFDPLTLGVYAGDIRKLSLRACFPSLHRLEQEKGSLVRSFLFAKKKRGKLFTLKGGMQTLIDALSRRLPIEIKLQCRVEKISPKEVITNQGIYQGDRVISALPYDLPKKSLWVVNLAYSEDVLKKKGFGYLVPSQEGEALLGIVFDSVIFPSQNQRGETRLTAMIRNMGKDPLEIALKALQKHLKIQKNPIYSSVFFAKEAIPQFEIGRQAPYGISVDACVHRGRSIIN